MRKTAILEFPSLQMLGRGLELAIKGNGATASRVRIQNRESAPFLCSYPSELVSCRFDDGSVRRLYCKYGEAEPETSPNHRHGVGYEARVYRHVLQPLKASTARYYGAHTDSRTGKIWLFLEYLEESSPVNHAPDPASLVVSAAHWIGKFHAANELDTTRAPISSLRTYDAEYYRGWSGRTLQFSGDLHRKYPWLEIVCRQFEDSVSLFLSKPAAVIHGEYESDNLLVRDAIIYPVDWESSAIAAGEIDLASLTWDWPHATVRACELEYQQARWPQGAPAEFQQRLGIARMYLLFRWLGDRPRWTKHKSSTVLFEQLRLTGKRMGLI